MLAEWECAYVGSLQGSLQHFRRVVLRSYVVQSFWSAVQLVNCHILERL